MKDVWIDKTHSEGSLILYDDKYVYYRDSTVGKFRRSEHPFRYLKIGHVKTRVIEVR